MGQSLTPSTRSQAKRNAPKITRLVDNKHCHMERKLSQTQYGQILMTTAEVAMKKKSLEAIGKSNKAFELRANRG